MKHLRLIPKALTWQSILILMLAVLMLVQVGAVSLALALPDGDPAAAHVVAWEPVKPPPPPPGDCGLGCYTTNGYDWGGSG